MGPIRFFIARSAVVLCFDPSFNGIYGSFSTKKKHARLSSFLCFHNPNTETRGEQQTGISKVRRYHLLRSLKLIAWQQIIASGVRESGI